jgi:hypothetical protein
MTFKAYLNEEMSNEAYHAETEHISGSSLADIFSSCPAAWRFKERTESKALAFGTQAHTNVLENEKFDKIYRRAPAQEDYEDLITSQAALATKLKSMGITGTSGKQYPELMEMLEKTGEKLNVWWDINNKVQQQAEIDGVELIPAKDYDMCIAMREVLFNIPEYASSLSHETAITELSIFGLINGTGVKVRLDHVAVEEIDGIETVVITDYKTTQSADPKEFGRLACNHGYLLKMALQRDLFVKTYNEKRPVVVRLLAQEKKAPYLPMRFTLTDSQIKIGRRQYMSALALYSKCKEYDSWPGYNMGDTDCVLEIPEWYARQYEDSTNS